LEGLKYYLLPDFSKINGKVLLLALSQAFFSLCIGEAVLITYGSYAAKKENLLSSAGYVALFDTLIAFFAGLIIFPAVFAFNISPNQGIGLSFIVLPDIFSKMFAGNIFGALFFLLLTFAGLSTTIALLEIPVIYLIDAKKWKRKNAVLFVGFLAFIFGIPSALSKGICPFLSNFKVEIIEQSGFLNLMDFVWGNLGMVITGWLLAIFTGWVWGIDEAIKELKISCTYFDKYQNIWKYSIKYIAPVVIFLILLNLF
jgi:NSS family neurotransmitter:Na+ symporter